MKKITVRKTTGLGVLITLLALSIAHFGNANELQARHDGAIALQLPPFLSLAHAEENAIDSFADDEAGIAAYFDSGISINLNDVDQLYRTIETQTSSYILGSIPIADYDEDHDVHMYISTDGWVMAYYQDNEPASKIYDWKHYDGNANLPTKLELGLDIVAAEIGAIATPSFYHFNYPNATDLMLIAEWLDDQGTDSFNVSIPSGFSYYERSWSLSKNATNTALESNYFLDGSLVFSLEGVSGWQFAEGAFSAAQFAPDTLHAITLEQTSPINNTASFAGLALVYRVP